ncbi:MAG: hypothetical protein Q8N83_13335 [Ignavibacteria bacterium]|nr:hypothetical protein [Ignavibacteria bacterium]
MKNYFIENTRIPIVDMFTLIAVILVTAYPNYVLYHTNNSSLLITKYLPEIFIVFTLVIMMTPFNNNLRNIHFLIIVFIYTLILYLLSHQDSVFKQVCFNVGEHYLELVQIPFISFLYLITMRTMLILIYKKEPLTIWLRIGVFSSVESIYSERIGRKATYYDLFWSMLNYVVMGVIFIFYL